ncbi:MAG: Flagellar biosynthesis protein FliO [Cyanobacteria bacterium RYN_339]|nr:Flagellar biosynthesis protein FliO [Cyanobacteria bacterium RYN_339]
MTRFLLLFGLLLAFGAAPAYAVDENVVAPTSELEAGGAGLDSAQPEPVRTPMAAVPQDEVKHLEAKPLLATTAAKKPAYTAEDQPFPLRDYEEPKPAAQAPWWQQALGFVFKLALVIGLIFVSLGVLKKLQGGRITLPNAKGKNMVVLETANLGPQQNVHLISLGGDRLLVVGASPQGVTKLAEITDPAQVRPFLNGSRSNPSDFNQVYDMEAVGADHAADLFAQTMNEVGERYGQRRPEWPR